MFNFRNNDATRFFESLEEVAKHGTFTFGQITALSIKYVSNAEKEIIMSVFQGERASNNNRELIQSPYVFLNGTTKEGFKQLLETWGLADHIVLILSGYVENHWLEPVISIPRFAKEHNCKMVCIIVGEVFSEVVDYSQIGVPVVYVIPNVGEFEFEGNVNLSKLCIGESNQRISHYTHYVFTEKSATEIESIICEDCASVSICETNSDTVSVRCPSDSSEEYNYFKVQKDITFDQQFISRFYLTIIGAFPHKFKTKFGLDIAKSHRNILQIGPITLDPKHGSPHDIGQYFLQNGIGRTLPLPLFPQGDSMVIISLENRKKTYLKTIFALMVTVNEKSPEAVFLLVDRHALLFSKRLLPENQQMNKVAKRVVAITSVRALTDVGIQWNIFLHTECQIQMFPVENRNNYVGTYQISYDDIIDQTIETCQSQMLYNIASKVISIDFPMDEDACEIKRSMRSNIGVETMVEYYKTRGIPTFQCLRDIVMSSLKSEQSENTFTDAPAVIASMDKWEIASNQCFGETRGIPTFSVPHIVMSSLKSVDAFTDAPAVVASMEKWEIASNQYFEDTVLMRIANYMVGMCSVKIGKAWARTIPCIIKQLIIAKENLKSETVTNQVTEVILQYIRMKTPETSQIFLKHPQAQLEFIVVKGKQLIIDKTLVKSILDSRDALCNIGLVLCHLGRTTELGTIFTFPHKCLMSYLLYCVGILQHEHNQRLEQDTAYTSIHDYQRIDACVRKFEELAQCIVQNCFEINENVVYTLFNSQVEHMNHHVIDLALMINARSVFSTRVCRKILNDRYWKHLAGASWFKILLIVCVPCIESCLSKPQMSQNNAKDEEGNKNDEQTCKVSCSKFASPCIKVHDIPAVKCLVHFVSFCAFLILFSLMVLTRLQNDLDGVEYAMLVWVVSSFAEEIHQLILVLVDPYRTNSITYRLRLYLNDIWNVMDICFFAIYYLAFSFRVAATISQNASLLTAAHILFVMDVILMFTSILRFCSMHMKIGPLFIMVQYMCKDMLYFMVLLLVTLLGYGVALQSVLHPHATSSWSLLWPIFQLPYQQLYGEFDIDDILAAPNATDSIGPEQTPGFRNYFGVFLTDCYLLATNILLLNLLIAMFNSSYEKVRENVEYHNNIRMNKVLLEYQGKSILPPPFSIVTYIYRGIQKCKNRKITPSQKNENSMQKNDHKNNELLTLVGNCVENCLAKCQLLDDHSQTKASNEGGGKTLSDKLDILNEYHNTLAEDMKVVKNELKIIQKRNPNKPKRQEMMDKMNTIHQTLDELKAELKQTKAPNDT